MENKDIIFMGTPQIAADVLERLIEENQHVSLVVCQPDRKVGRKQQVVFSPVKELAIRHGIPVFQPEKIRQDFSAIQDANPALIVTCAYGQIVPEEVLNAPLYGCVNLHGSLLPEYRGAAPIQRAIWDGKTETGMSLMKMEKGMDTGPVAAMASVAIDEEANTTSLFEKMGKLAADLLMDNLEDLLSGKAEFKEQDHEKATYAAMILKEDEELHLDLLTDTQIVNQIRALSIAPGAYVKVKGKKLKVLKAAYEPARNDEEIDALQPGLLEKQGKKVLYLHLHQGKLRLMQVQPEGKPVMDAASFVNGAGRSIIGTKVDEMISSASNTQSEEKEEDSHGSAA